MGWIIGIVVVAVLLKVLWVVLLFAAPVLIPLAILAGILVGGIWLLVLLGDVWRVLTGGATPPKDLPTGTSEASEDR